MKLTNIKNKSSVNFQTVIKMQRRIVNLITLYLDYNCTFNYNIQSGIILYIYHNLGFRNVAYTHFYIKDQIKETKKLKKVINHGRK
jgi:hypothetical protein